MIQKQQPKETKKLCERIVSDFNSCKEHRSTFDAHWDEIARLVWPNFRNTFKPGDTYNTPGEKKTSEQFDATPEIARSQFGAILDSLLTPRNQMWHSLTASDENLSKNREVQIYFEQATKALFRYRYAPEANFSSQNQMVYQMLGAFGTGVMFIDTLSTGRGIRYKAAPIGEVYIKENHQGIVDTVYRCFPMTPRQMAQKFTEDALPSSIVAKLGKGDGKEDTIWVIHVVIPREDYDTTRLDARGKPWADYYVTKDEPWMLQESGRTSFPYMATRYEQAPGEVYGRSPAMMALPAIKTLNQQKMVVLKQGHRTVDPVLLLPDDGIMDVVRVKPGAQNPGGVTSEGRPRVHTLPIGRVDIGLEMMDQERQMINAAFLVHLFQILTETPRMTATEVIERTREKGILLAPTIGRQQSEYLGPMINRELDILALQGILPPMPEILREAAGEYDVVYNSPLSRTMRAEEAAGALRTIETAMMIANATGDPSKLDRFDFDTILPELGDINGMPASWMLDDESLIAIRQHRAQQEERAARQQEVPGEAAMINAQAKAQVAARK